jgi:hypothetical protein
MKKRVHTIMGLSFAVVSMFFATTNFAQTHTPIGHVGLGGGATLSLSTGALDTAFAQDCNYDSASNFHGASFTAMSLTEVGGNWFIEAVGTVDTLTITRGIILTELGNGDLVCEADDGGGGTCEKNGCTSGCEMVGSTCNCGVGEDGGSSCTYKGGGILNEEGYLVPWGGARASFGPGHIGNLY